MGKKVKNKTDKLIWFPNELVERIERFMKDNYISYFTVAVIELVRRALEEEDEKNKEG